jgi:hypothetical protein
MERAAAEGLTFSYCSHDHSSTRDDPRMAITASLLHRARELGMQTLTYAAYYDRYLRTAPAFYTDLAGTGTTGR